METKVKNREWVKNAAIIFLAALLVLTFFSNTIMNRSLPEAATVAIRSDAITAKIRGAGTVESQGVYEVKAPETREIRSVMIKTGQKVETGDVLFVLGQGDSAEIEAAQEQLRQLKLSYQQTAAGGTNYSGKLQAAQTRYNNAVAAEAAALAELNGNADYVDARTALDAAKERYASADLNYRLANDTALASLASLSAAFGEFRSACESQGLDTLTLNDASYALDAARGAIALADSNLNSLAIASDKLQMAEQGVLQYELANGASLSPEAADKLLTLKTCFTQAKGYLTDNAPSSLLDAINDRLDALDRNTSAQNLFDGLDTLFSENYSKAVAERQAAESALKALQESADDYNRQAALTGLTLQDLKYQIDRAQEKLDKLTGGSENQIRSNVSGTVSSVSVTAGSKAEKDSVLATVEVPDMGYTLSFSVTTDQARRLRPGDSASVTSYYWGSRIDATLASIKTDPKNPTTHKLLEFDVSGDVSAGAQLTLSIGERSQNYDYVVPNSALRSDNNGKFILIIQAKNSALGNRYFARRVDVEVIASDDNNSALSGALNYGDYVITTASAPLKSGDQVRMAEG